MSNRGSHVPAAPRDEKALGSGGGVGESGIHVMQFSGKGEGSANRLQEDLAVT